MYCILILACQNGNTWNKLEAKEEEEEQQQAVHSTWDIHVEKT